MRNIASKALAQVWPDIHEGMEFKTPLIRWPDSLCHYTSSLWNQPPSDTVRFYPKLGEYLFQCKVIDKKQLDTFNKLRQLRNKVAHAEELNLSEKDAQPYIELASAMAAHIRAA